MTFIRVPLIERFWSRVVIKSDDECWEWIGNKSHNGYGTMAISHGVMIRAHRLSWMLCCGDLQKDILVLHHCDNPSCVNPKHLFIGTHKDNAVDAKVKGRWTRGEKSGRSKLKESDVKLIRERYKNKERNLTKKASKEFGVSTSAIKFILYGRNWKEVK